VRHTSSVCVLASTASFECDCDLKEPVNVLKTLEITCIGILAKALS
jgi:hypothetical protein